MVASPSRRERRSAERAGTIPANGELLGAFGIVSKEREPLRIFGMPLKRIGATDCPAAAPSVRSSVAMKKGHPRRPFVFCFGLRPV
jgi:hypothetical protein